MSEDQYIFGSWESDCLTERLNSDAVKSINPHITHYSQMNSLTTRRDPPPKPAVTARANGQRDRKDASLRAVRVVDRQWRISQKPVSRSFRDALERSFKALVDHEQSDIYWGIMQVLLFPLMKDRQSGYPVLPYDLVAAVAGIDIRRHEPFSARALLEQFSRDVFPLRIQSSNFRAGRATVVQPIFPSHVQSVLKKEKHRLSVDGEGNQPEALKGMVWLRTGKPITTREWKQQRMEWRRLLREMEASIPLDHPARPLIDVHLSNEGQTRLRKVINENLPALEALLWRQQIDLAPTQSIDGKYARCMLAMRILREMRDMGDEFTTHYSASPRSVRIYANGPSPNRLPREYRKLLLGGAFECDLAACQLAVVAKVWNYQGLYDVLRSGTNMWELMLTYLDLPAEYKPIIKITVYAIVFGMSRTNLKTQLCNGTAGDAGIGEMKADKFFKHSLIYGLLEARDTQMNKLIKQGKATDAFGQVRKLIDQGKDGNGQSKRKTSYGKRVGDENGFARKRRLARSLMACVVQSYEMKLMLSMVPLLEKYRDRIGILAFLHDGIVLDITSGPSQQKLINRIVKAVRDEADKLDIPTSLEVNELPRIEFLPEHCSSHQEAVDDGLDERWMSSRPDTFNAFTADHEGFDLPEITLMIQSTMTAAGSLPNTDVTGISTSVSDFPVTDVEFMNLWPDASMSGWGLQVP